MGKRIAVVIAGQIFLAAGLFALFRLQMDQEKGELILRSNMMAMFYANPTHTYTESYRREFYDFGYPGPKATFQNPFQITGGYPFNYANFSDFAILLKEQVDQSADPHLKEAFYSPLANRIQEYDRIVAVNLPLLKPGAGAPYGLVRIESNLKYLPRDIFYKNLLSYLLIAVFYNGLLLVLAFGLFRKPKQTVVYLEKGYLKEYALGALKLHHKILGQIIEDHDQPEPQPEPEHGPGPLVIKLDSRPARKKSSGE